MAELSTLLGSRLSTSTLNTEMGLIQERIAPSIQGSITSVQAVSSWVNHLSSIDRRLAV